MRIGEFYTIGHHCVYVHSQHGPYRLFHENGGWYTLYSIVNTNTGFAILHWKVPK